MIANSKLVVSKNSFDQLIFQVRLVKTNYLGLSSSWGRSSYSVDSLLTTLGSSRHQLVDRFGQQAFDEVLMKIGFLKAKVGEYYPLEWKGCAQAIETFVHSLPWEVPYCPHYFDDRE